MIAIPATPNGVACWTQRTTIEGVSYTLRFDWSQRAGKWRLDFADVDGDAIASGVALLTDYPLMRTVRDARLPTGLFVVLDTLGLAQDPTFSSLGTRHLLVYYARAEL